MYINQSHCARVCPSVCVQQILSKPHYRLQRNPAPTQIQYLAVSSTKQNSTNSIRFPAIAILVPGAPPAPVWVRRTLATNYPGKTECLS